TRSTASTSSASSAGSSCRTSAGIWRAFARPPGERPLSDRRGRNRRRIAVVRRAVGRILPVLLGLTFAVSACAAPAPRDAGPAWEYVSAPFLVAAAEDASMPCGLARDYKIGARLDPPRQIGRASCRKEGKCRRAASP